MYSQQFPPLHCLSILHVSHSSLGQYATVLKDPHKYFVHIPDWHSYLLLHGAQSGLRGVGDGDDVAELEGEDVEDGVGEDVGVEDGLGFGKHLAMLSWVPSVHLYFVQYPCLHCLPLLHFSHSSFKKHLRLLYIDPLTHLPKAHLKDWQSLFFLQTEHSGRPKHLANDRWPRKTHFPFTHFLVIHSLPERQGSHSSESGCFLGFLHAKASIRMTASSKIKIAPFIFSTVGKKIDVRNEISSLASEKWKWLTDDESQKTSEFYRPASEIFSVRAFYSEQAKNHFA